MANKIKDDQGNVYIEVLPWYKRWQNWLSLVIVVLACGVLVHRFGSQLTTTTDNKSYQETGSASQTSSSDDSNSDTNTDSDDSSASDDSPQITVDYKKYDVDSKKVYKLNYTDSSWNAAQVKVDKVTVYKLAEDYKYDSTNDGKFTIDGFVRIHMTVAPTRDISIYPTQGTVVYNNGEQHEADSDETWDGDIAKGASKSGTVTIPVKNLGSETSLKTIRFKFDGNYDTDDMDDNNSDKTYDITMNLN